MYHSLNLHLAWNLQPFASERTVFECYSLNHFSKKTPWALHAKPSFLSALRSEEVSSLSFERLKIPRVIMSSTLSVTPVRFSAIEGVSRPATVHFPECSPTSWSISWSYIMFWFPSLDLAIWRPHGSEWAVELNQLGLFGVWKGEVWQPGFATLDRYRRGVFSMSEESRTLKGLLFAFSYCSCCQAEKYRRCAYAIGCCFHSPVLFAGF